MRVDAGPLGVVETAPQDEDAPRLLSRTVTCRARQWRAGVVVHAAGYSAEVPLPVRRGAFGVLNVEVYKSWTRGSWMASHRPGRRSWYYLSGRWFEPRVTRLPEEVDRQMHGLDLTIGEDGNIVERPTDPGPSAGRGACGQPASARAQCQGRARRSSPRPGRVDPGGGVSRARPRPPHAHYDR